MTNTASEMIRQLMMGGGQASVSVAPTPAQPQNQATGLAGMTLEEMMVLLNLGSGAGIDLTQPARPVMQHVVKPELKPGPRPAKPAPPKQNVQPPTPAAPTPAVDTTSLRPTQTAPESSSTTSQSNAESQFLGSSTAQQLLDALTAIVTPSRSEAPQSNRHIDTPMYETLGINAQQNAQRPGRPNVKQASTSTTGKASSSGLLFSGNVANVKTTKPKPDIKIDVDMQPLEAQRRSAAGMILGMKPLDSIPKPQLAEVTVTSDTTVQRLNSQTGGAVSTSSASSPISSTSSSSSTTSSTSSSSASSTGTTGTSNQGSAVTGDANMMTNDQMLGMFGMGFDPFGTNQGFDPSMFSNVQTGGFGLMGPVPAFGGMGQTDLTLRNTGSGSVSPRDRLAEAQLNQIAASFGVVGALGGAGSGFSGALDATRASSESGPTTGTGTQTVTETKPAEATLTTVQDSAATTVRKQPTSVSGPSASQSQTQTSMSEVTQSSQGEVSAAQASETATSELNPFARLTQYQTLSQGNMISLADILGGRMGFGAGLDQQSMDPTGLDAGFTMYDTQAATGSLTGDINVDTVQNGTVSDAQQTNFTPLGKVGAGSSFEWATAGIDSGQPEYIWDPITQQWMLSTGAVTAGDSTSVTSAASSTSSQGTSSTDTTFGSGQDTARTVSSTGGHDTVSISGTQDTAGSISMTSSDLFTGQPITGLEQQTIDSSISSIGSNSLTTVDQGQVSSTFAQEMGGIGLGTASTAPVDPAPTQSTIATSGQAFVSQETVKPLEEFTNTQTKVSAETSVDTTRTAAERQREAELLMQRQREEQVLQAERRRQQELQMMLQKQREELRRLEQQKQEQEQQLLLEKQRVEFERQQLLMKKQQIELERKRKERLRLELQMKEIEQQEQRMREAKTTTTPTPTTPAPPTTVVKQPVTSISSQGSSTQDAAASKVQPVDADAPAFTPIGHVGTSAGSTADVAAAAAWQAVLAAASLHQEPGSQVSAQTLPAQIQGTPAVQSVPQVLNPTWPALAGLAQPGVQPAGQPAVPVVPGAAGQQPANQQNVLLWNLLQQQQAAAGAGAATQGGAAGQPMQAQQQQLLLQQLLQQQQKLQAPTTTPKPPTTTKPPPPKPQVPIRPDPETRRFVRSMFLNNMGPGSNPMDILIGLTPELLMKSGVNPIIANSGDIAKIVPAVERVLGISITRPGPGGARRLPGSFEPMISSDPGPGGSPSRSNSLQERARARREFLMQQQMMNEMMQLMGLGPEPLEPGDPGYRGPSARGGRGGAPGMGGAMGAGMGGPMGGGAAGPMEMTDAQQLAIERRMSRQGGMGAGMGPMGPMGGVMDPMGMSGMAGGAAGPNNPARLLETLGL